MNHSYISNSKLLLTNLFCLLLTCLSFGQVSKKTYQTIIAGNAEAVRINITGANVDFKETKGSRILVETMIKLSVPNEALLNFVIENGRYELSQTMDASTRELVLESKKDKNVIVVKGEICAEEVTYIVYVPSNIRTIK